MHTWPKPQTKIATKMQIFLNKLSLVPTKEMNTQEKDQQHQVNKINILKTVCVRNLFILDVPNRKHSYPKLLKATSKGAPTTSKMFFFWMKLES